MDTIESTIPSPYLTISILSIFFTTISTPHLSNVDVDLSAPISRNEDIINKTSVEEDYTIFEEDGFIPEGDFASPEDENISEEEILQE